MFKTRVVAILIVAALALTAAPPRTDAAPATDIWTIYYDCSMHWMGEKFRGCDSTGYNMGITNAGYFKNTESCSCYGTTCTNRWYKWTGTTWTQLPGEPAAEC